VVIDKKPETYSQGWNRKMPTQTLSESPYTNYFLDVLN
jgi:hypothetical protein